MFKNLVSKIMIATGKLSLKFGKRVLFDDVSIKFSPGNCYGLIGANGAGKSTFLKILAGEVEPTSGEVILDNSDRLAVLKQDHFAFDDNLVLETVIRGHKQLYDVIREKDTIYAKENFSDADGIRVSELEEKFEQLNGWEAEAEAASLLSGLGIADELHHKKMKDLDASDKIKALLAQALFGNPDVLLLDEPTNHLKLEAVMWLEDFLLKFRNTVIVVSHDRHFLNHVCTHIADVDFGKITLYGGNYDFWYQSSQLALKQAKDANKKKEEKIKELQDFISRFSSNASKSKQATSRKKMLEKINLDEIRPSTRRYPYIDFKQEREAGKNILEIHALRQNSESGETLFQNIGITINKGDKIALVGPHETAKSVFMQTLAGELAPHQGGFNWGETITMSYFPSQHDVFFDNDKNLINWLRQFSKEQDEHFIRGYLGRMLFSGEETSKKCNVLSGGEKVRCLLARMMLSNANFLILDDPTNHLDLEAITSLNQGLVNFQGSMIFTSRDHEIIQTVANRIIEITPHGIIDKQMLFDEYLASAEIAELRDELYGSHLSLD